MWVRIDDSLGDDPRILETGVIGAGVLALTLAYSNRNLTDGWIPAAEIRRLLMKQDGSSDVAGDLALERLLAVKLLTSAVRDCIPGFQLHADYVALQPTSEKIRKQRSDRRRQKIDAGRLGGIAKSEARRQQKASSGVAGLQQKCSSDVAPVPDPDPLKEKNTAAVASGFQPRERAIVGHGKLCEVYKDVLRTEHGDEGERKEALKEKLVKLGIRAQSPDALRAAMDAVEHVARLRSTEGRRTTGGFEHVAARR